MKRVLITINCFLAISLSSALDIFEYFPLGVGSQWTYQNGGSGNVTANITGFKTINGIETRILSYSDDEKIFVLSDYSGIYFYGLQDSTGIYIFQTPVGLSTTSFSAGDNIITNWGVRREGSDVQNTWGILTSEVLSTSDTRTINGTQYKDLVKVELGLTGKSLYYFYLAKNIGIVEYESPTTFGTRTLISSSVVALKPVFRGKVQWNDINVFPNPGRKGQVQIRFLNPLQNAALTLWTPKGRLLKRIQNIREAWHVLNLKSLPSGNYIVKVNTPNQTFTKSITVRK